MKRTQKTSTAAQKSGSIAVFEPLEHRQHLSIATQINYPDFSSTKGLVANGYKSAAVTVDDKLQLTNGGFAQARSVWYAKPVPINEFSSSFSFRSAASDTSADGFTFTIQGGTTASLGTEGRNLGYSHVPKSVGVAFNLFNFGSFGSHFGFATGSTEPQTDTDMGAIDLHSGHLFRTTVTYGGGEMAVTVRDASDPSKVFSASTALDLDNIIGSDRATVGFTGATGVNRAKQYVTSWSFSGGTAPTISAQATATPNPVSATTTQLSAVGADSRGEAGLTYAWTTLSKPQNASAPIFSDGGTNAAKSISATFFQAGTYRFACTVTNTDGATATSDPVLVQVQQTASTMRISPHMLTLIQGQSVTYNAVEVDQFNNPMRHQPTSITFSVLDGDGVIDPNTGVYTATGSVAGHVVIGASSDDIGGSVGATVLNSSRFTVGGKRRPT